MSFRDDHERGSDSRQPNSEDSVNASGSAGDDAPSANTNPDAARTEAEAAKDANAGSAASNDVTDELYEQLRRIAHQRFAAFPPTASMQATELLHEAFLKLDPHSWNDRAHYLAAFSRASQQIMIDIARRRQTGRKVLKKHALVSDLASPKWQDPVEAPEEFLLLSSAIDALRETLPDTADAIFMHYIVGISTDDIAAATGQHPRTIQRRLEAGRLWVGKSMDDALDLAAGTSHDAAG